MINRIVTLLAIFVLLLTGFIIGVESTQEAEPTIADVNVTTTVGTAMSPIDPVLVLDLDNEYGESNMEKAEAPISEEGPTIHEDLRDETPPGVPEEAAEEIIEDVAAPGMVGEPLPIGGAQNYNCRRNLVRNFSNRTTGTTVGLFNLHYTVSKPGSLDAIRGLFNRPSFGASSHLGLEPLTGRCEQWVAWNNKAWTQGAFNSVSESVEIMAMGTEPRSWWLNTKIIKNEILAAIMVDRLRARGIPPRRVDPVGCGVQLTGWTDHNALECGNTHFDVRPNFPYDVLQTQIVRRYNAGQPKTRLPGPRPKPAWFWKACGEAIGGQFVGLTGPRPKPMWFWKACNQWDKEH